MPIARRLGVDGALEVELADQAASAHVKVLLNDFDNLGFGDVGRAIRLDMH